jgi:ubiquinone/menaquinone biosynthesis C-methylase UbiE
MPFKSETFDVATMYSVLHHLPDLSSSLKEINRIMTPKARLILFHEPHEKRLRQVSEKTLIRILGKIRRTLHRTMHRRKWQHFEQERLYRSVKLGELEKLADIHSPKGFGVIEMKTLLELNGFQVTNIKTRIQFFMATFSRLHWPYKLIATLDFILSEAPILSNYLPLLLCIAEKKA